MAKNNNAKEMNKNNANRAEITNDMDMNINEANPKCNNNNNNKNNNN